MDIALSLEMKFHVYLNQILTTKFIYWIGYGTFYA